MDKQGEMMITIDIPWLGPTLNEIYSGGHWSKRKRVKDIGRLAVNVAVKNLGKLPTLDFPVKITLQPLLGKGKTRYDLVNYCYGLKIIEDGLVRLGILPDDSEKYVNAFEIKSPRRIKGDSISRITIEFNGDDYE